MNALTNSSISNGFDTVFSEVDSTKKLNLKNNNCLRLFYLDIFNNEFTYTGLHQLLQRNIGRYVFSRASIEQFKAEGDAEAIGLKAIELLRKANNPNDNGAGGELGEILLYLFQLDNKNFQLILGESKIKGVLSKAVDEAFESIEKVSKNPDNELRLIEKNILSESFDEETTEFIKSLIVPLKRDKTISVDNAFGIFLGYTLNIDATQYSNSEFRNVVNEKLRNDLYEIASYIEKKINESGLTGYSFYFYILPFNNAKDDRAAIINKLKGE